MNYNRIDQVCSCCCWLAFLLLLLRRERFGNARFDMVKAWIELSNHNTNHTSRKYFYSAFGEKIWGISKLSGGLV